MMGFFHLWTKKLVNNAPGLSCNSPWPLSFNACPCFSEMSYTSLCFLLQLSLVTWPVLFWWGGVSVSLLFWLGFFSILLFPHCVWGKSPVCCVDLLLYLSLPDLHWVSLHCCLLLCFLCAFQGALALNLPLFDPDSCSEFDFKTANTILSYLSITPCAL